MEDFDSDDDLEDEDPEEQYEEEIRDELAVQVIELFEENTGIAPSQEEEELLSEFIFYISSDRFPDVTDYFINECLARHVIKFPYIKYGKKELEKIKFMSHFYHYMFENLLDEDSKEKVLDFAVIHLRGAYRCFRKIDDEEVKDRIRIYDDIVSQWYIANYPEITEDLVKVDKLPEKKQERIKDRTLEMIAITHSAMAQGDIEAVENHLSSLGRKFRRYIF